MASFKDYIRFRKSCCYDNSQCLKCPLFRFNNDGKTYCGDFIENHPDEAEAIIDKWCKEHPAKTRQSEILKLFPNTLRDDNGIMELCPKKLCPDTVNCICNCSECKEKFWNEEIE